MALVNKTHLAEELMDLFPKLSKEQLIEKIKYWWKTKKIPGTKMGHRSLFFNPLKVRRVFEKNEINEGNNYDY